MPSRTNLRIRYALGAVMLVLGCVVLSRMYILGLPPRIGSRGVDTIFGIFLVLRGALNFRGVMRRDGNRRPATFSETDTDQTKRGPPPT
jgi:hypothetical protein